VIFIDEAAPSPEILPTKIDVLQKVSVSVLALIIVFLGVIPTPLVARILASVP
jgi:hypothetical protein